VPLGRGPGSGLGIVKETTVLSRERSVPSSQKGEGENGAAIGEQPNS
jgi:hypothetical protein